MKLYISSGVHISRKSTMSKREDNINAAVPDLDVVFTEGRESNISPTLKIRNWVLCPLLLVAVVVYETFIQVAGVFLAYDGDMAERLADNHEVSLYKIDKPFHTAISEGWYLWGLANWALIALPAILYIGSSGNPPIRQFAIYLFITAGIALFAAFVAGTMQARNFHMLQEINRLSRENGVESACLVTGGAHEDDLQELAELFDIQVIGTDV